MIMFFSLYLNIKKAMKVHIDQRAGRTNTETMKRSHLLLFYPYCLPDNRILDIISINIKLYHKFM